MSTAPRFVHFGRTPVDPQQKDISTSVVSGDPQQKVWLYSDCKSAGARSGMWDCQPGVSRATMDGIMEFCCIIEGSARIRDLTNGDVHEVVAGDAFVMTPGLETEWTVDRYVRKYFVITDAGT